MQRLWPVVLTICILGIPDRVLAEDEKVELEVAPEGAIEMDFDAVKGIWIPLDMAKKIQLDVERTKLYELKLKQMDTKLDIRQERIDTCKEALSNTEKSRDKAWEAANDLEEAVEALENEEKAWYEKPVIWFGAGVVVIMILEVGAVALLSAI